MPIYDYFCGVCSVETEIKTSFDDRDKITCEICGNEMARQMSIPSIQFKGSGFYSTDNRRK